MKFRDFTYQIGDEVILKEQVAKVEVDGVVCTIEYVSSLPEGKCGYIARSISVPAEFVEVIVDAE